MCCSPICRAHDFAKSQDGFRRIIEVFTSPSSTPSLESILRSGLPHIQRTTKLWIHCVFVGPRILLGWAVGWLLNQWLSMIFQNLSTSLSVNLLGARLWIGCRENGCLPVWSCLAWNFSHVHQLTHGVCFFNFLSKISSKKKSDNKLITLPETNRKST